MLSFWYFQLAQVDICQSDAYSVEEMCAREAEQSNTEDYSNAYETCIEKSRDRKMYRSDQNKTEAQEYSIEQSDENIPKKSSELPTEEAQVPEQALAY